MAVGDTTYVYKDGLGYQYVCVEGQPFYEACIEQGFTAQATPYLPTMGKTDKGGTEYAGAGDGLWCEQYTAAASSKIYRMAVYVKNSTGSAKNMQFGIYAENSGAAGVNLAHSDTVSVANGFDGWKTVDMELDIVAGTKYWLSYQIKAGLKVYYDAGGDHLEGFAEPHTFGSWTDSPTVAYDSYRSSVYVFYNAMTIFPGGNLTNDQPIY